MCQLRVGGGVHRLSSQVRSRTGPSRPVARSFAGQTTSKSAICASVTLHMVPILVHVLQRGRVRQSSDTTRQFTYTRRPLWHMRGDGRTHRRTHGTRAVVDRRAWADGWGTEVGWLDPPRRSHVFRLDRSRIEEHDSPLYAPVAAVPQSRFGVNSLSDWQQN
jgi:hypothetical protein